MSLGSVWREQLTEQKLINYLLLTNEKHFFFSTHSHMVKKLTK